MPEIGRKRKTEYSMADYKRLYTRLRRLYFLDPGENLHIPPPVEELRWYWLPPQDSALAMTTFDEDGDPQDIGFDPMTRVSYHIIRYVMLHEMTHMRIGSKWCCGQLSHAWLGARVPRNTLWHAETKRLVEAGALTL
jgi:hypothetical protein